MLKNTATVVNNSITRSGMQIDKKVTVVIILLLYNVVQGQHSAKPLNVNGNVFCQTVIRYVIKEIDGAGHQTAFRSQNSASLEHF